MATVLTLDMNWQAPEFCWTVLRFGGLKGKAKKLTISVLEENFKV